MGARWLRDLPEVLAGLPGLSLYPGWDTRSRASGGYDALLGITVHHTASTTTIERDCAYQWSNAKDRPIGAILLGRAGEIVVGAAGATNCQGVGGPRACSRGTIPANRGNANSIAIEAANNGIGEVWPEVQQNAYIAVVQRLVRAYGYVPSDVFAHREWTTRKIDPAGPSRFGSVNVNGSWDMDLFRGEVAGGPIVIPPPVEPPPVVTPPPAQWYDQLMAELPVLRQGSTGPFVKRMQHLLAAAGFMDPANTGNYDGVFGSGTTGALNRFKASAGGSQDGTCDSWTWGALMHTIDGIPTIVKGNTGPDVERMQHLLAAAGFLNEANVANYDGVWGNGTDSAKVKFDNAKGLTPSPPTDCGKGSWTRLLKG